MQRAVVVVNTRRLELLRKAIAVVQRLRVEALVGSGRCVWFVVLIDPRDGCSGFDS